MNKEFICQGLESYVVLEAEDGEEYEYRMLFSNEIPYLLPVRIDAVNQKGRLIYQTTGYRSLQDIYEKQWMTCEDLKWIMKGLLAAVESVKQYLLLPDSLLLLPDTVFLDREKGEIRVLYAPGGTEQLENQMKMLMEYLMGRINPEDVDGVVLIWRIYMMLREERGSLRSIQQCLMDKNEPVAVKNQILSEKPKSRPAKRLSLVLWKPEKRWTYGAFVLGGVFLLLSLAGLYLIYHIYRFGILEWKRNCLIFLAGALAADGMGLLWTIKNDRKERKMNDLFYLK